MPQESLLPDTKAIKKGTVEWQPYRRGWLVRHKSVGGYVIQKQFKDAEKASDFFWQQVDRLKDVAALKRF